MYELLGELIDNDEKFDEFTAGLFIDDDNDEDEGKEKRVDRYSIMKSNLKNSRSLRRYESKHKRFLLSCLSYFLFYMCINQKNKYYQRSKRIVMDAKQSI
jgi:hypothetical protein